MSISLTHKDTQSDETDWTDVLVLFWSIGGGSSKAQVFGFCSVWHFK